MLPSDRRMDMKQRDAFEKESKIIISGKIYLVCRHFSGKRDFKQAIFMAAENEAKREESHKKPQ